MLEVKGKYTTARIHHDQVDDTSMSQIFQMVNSPAITNPVEIMPDFHAGNGAVIGFTMEASDIIIPGIVGVDIGCGMMSCKVTTPQFSREEIDILIRKVVPLGFNINASNQFYDWEMADDTYRIADMVGMSKSRLELSVGSLGGGNHFIEVGRGPEDADNYMWITIHSGSRNFGKMVADFYQNKAVEYSGRKAGVAKGMEYMPTSDYMSGMMVAQRYAQLNRVAMMTNIIDALNCTLVEEINCTHNYISERDHIIRKGAVSAHVGDKIILPFNREDGIWVLSGKGNKDWNLSAPHGAGRQMSRSQAKKMMTQKYVDDKMSESGVYSSFNPIDEAPDAYKPAKDIQKFVADTAKYEFSIKPIVNIKG